MKTPLTPPEVVRLKHLESIIEKGKVHYEEVCKALAEICDRELWRETHDTFADYCKDVHGLTHWNVRHMADFHRVKTSLPAAVGKSITTDRQARELKPVPRALRPAVVAAGAGLALKAGKPLTSIHLNEGRKLVGGAAAPAPTVHTSQAATFKAEFTNFVNRGIEKLSWQEMRDLQEHIRKETIRFDGAMLKKKLKL